MSNYQTAGGVSYEATRKKWRAQQKVQLRQPNGSVKITAKNLGRFATKAEAQAAFLRFREEHPELLVDGFKPVFLA